MKFELTKEQLQLVIVAVSTAYAVSAQHGLAEQAEEFSQLREELADLLWPKR